MGCLKKSHYVTANFRSQVVLLDNSYSMLSLFILWDSRGLCVEKEVRPTRTLCPLTDHEFNLFKLLFHTEKIYSASSRKSSLLGSFRIVLEGHIIHTSLLLFLFLLLLLFGLWNFAVFSNFYKHHNFIKSLLLYQEA